MPDVSGVTVVTNARVYYSTRAAADAPSVRHSLRPLSKGRNVVGKTRAKHAARSRPHILTSLRGALATKQSSFLVCRKMDYFASLAMTLFESGSISSQSQT
jgi:hypothetical protein